MTSGQKQADYGMHVGAPVFGARTGHRVPLLSPPGPVVPWASLFLPEHFRAASPDFHWQLSDFLDSPARLGAASCPRGHAKSTLSDLGYLLWAVAHGRVGYVLIIADTLQQAELYLDEVRTVCEDPTSRLRTAYPGLAPGSTWRRDDLLFANGARVQALGVGQKVRGRKHGGRRPDFVLLDDAENDDAVQTLERRVKLRRWLYAAVLPALAPGARLRVVGTVLHRDSLLARLLRTQGWERRRWQALQEDGTALWPEWRPAADLLKDRAEAQAAGLLDVWYQEYQGVSRAAEGASFQPDDIVYFDDWPRDEHGERLECYRTLFVDPAISKSDKADFTGYTVVYATFDGRWWVMDAFRKRHDPSETLNAIRRLHRRHRFHSVGIEAVAYQKALVHWAEEQSREDFEYLPIDGIRPDGDKRRRILALQPYFRARRVAIRSGLSGRLEEELLNLDDCDHDDLADSLSGHLEITIRPEPPAKREERYADDASRFAAEDRKKRAKLAARQARLRARGIDEGRRK